MFEGSLFEERKTIFYNEHKAHLSRRIRNQGPTSNHLTIPIEDVQTARHKLCWEESSFSDPHLKSYYVPLLNIIPVLLKFNSWFFFMYFKIVIKIKR